MKIKTYDPVNVRKIENGYEVSQPWRILGFKRLARSYYIYRDLKNLRVQKYTSLTSIGPLTHFAVLIEPDVYCGDTGDLGDACANVIIHLPRNKIAVLKAKDIDGTFFNDHRYSAKSLVDLVTSEEEAEKIAYEKALDRANNIAKSTQSRIENTV